MSPNEEGVTAWYILIVEDNPGDVQLIKEAFLRVNQSIHFHVPNDGTGALAFLRHEEPFANVPRPDLILMDLAMPRMHGRDLLARIKQDDEVKTIPIVILSSSDAPADVASSYRLHANSYLRKPMHLEELYKIAQSVNEFWLIQARLPTGPGQFGSL